MPSNTDSAGDTNPSGTGAPPRNLPTSYRDSAPPILPLLLAFRLTNALALHTFFQPDEFFQSQEPAWQLAFGDASNAWITWEWTSRLRSSLHPALFAAVYRVAAHVAQAIGLSLPAKAEILLAAPKVTQAVSAALLDCYTWKLAGKVYGRGSRTALAALALSVCSPWQWFCATRTLSNCLETTITSIAIYHWPWQGTTDTRQVDPSAKAQQHSHPHLGSLSQLRLSLLLAAVACILRPTNALIWISVALPTLWQASQTLRYVLVRETLLCGCVVFLASLASDRLYYGVWTIPSLRFLYFNIAQSLAVFYGKNRADYYFTEGLPLLLTTALPFAIVGLWQSLQPQNQDTTVGHRILTRLSWTTMIMTVTLSLISHKEVRFLYPVLPFLHVISAQPLTQFLPAHTAAPWRRGAILLLLAANILLAGYASQVHQRGVIDVVGYIRHKHETRNTLSSMSSSHHHQGSCTNTITNTTVAFLMPCHSTPWRSHLVYPEISAWALTCEPPIHVPLADRSAYLDEADEFYIRPGPAAWLKANMEDVETVRDAGSRSGQHWMRQDPKFKRKYRREWPQNLVFFEQLEGVLKEHLAGSRYRECWRGFNSHFHDDWRRVGDVVVWCLDG
ncbi:glycosyltransferase family 22 protein [Bipolaris zeicola 26-R-13]|uniref:Mannosyltransferase n=1 Tax=Cochliobolus carbonum (strain 26-R-13) TaxID=930089 RepID=W6Y1K7_COCC2|nr:glycosyltransferase family 22 protein [Bipolaris zeicola 26-R-13]EUC33637.1 glycosyltransferase family 22 protein [Bipolaris zeicola 26-R-13]